MTILRKGKRVLVLIALVLLVISVGVVPVVFPHVFYSRRVSRRSVFFAVHDHNSTLHYYSNHVFSHEEFKDYGNGLFYVWKEYSLDVSDRCDGLKIFTDLYAATLMGDVLWRCWIEMELWRNHPGGISSERVFNMSDGKGKDPLSVEVGYSLGGGMEHTYVIGLNGSGLYAEHPRILKGEEPPGWVDGTFADSSVRLSPGEWTFVVRFYANATLCSQLPIIDVIREYNVLYNVQTIVLEETREPVMGTYALLAAIPISFILGVLVTYFLWRVSPSSPKRRAERE